jgi:hypothetical protein
MLRQRAPRQFNSLRDRVLMPLSNALFVPSLPKGDSISCEVKALRTQ